MSSGKVGGGGARLPGRGAEVILIKRKGEGAGE